MPDQSQNRGTALRWVTCCGLLGLSLGVISGINRIDPDAYHQMALVREAMANHAMPTQDVFAYTPTINPSIHHEWGTGIIFYAASMNFGSFGMILLKYGGALLVALGCFALARYRGASVEVFALLAPVAILCGCIGFFSVRAQLFTLLGTVCLLYFLEEDQHGRRGWIIAWLPLYVVWLNVHAGFLVGVGLFGIYLMGSYVKALRRHQSMFLAFRETRHLLGVAAAMAMLFGCNPYGWNYAPFLWRAVRLERPFVAEWQAVWHLPPLLAVYVVSLLPLAYVVRRRLIATFPDLVMVVVPALLAFQHLRHLSIYAVVWASYVPASLEKTELGRLIRSFSHKYRVMFALLWIALGAIGLTQAIHNRFWELRIPTTHADDEAIHYPVGAVAYLNEFGFTGNVMVPFSVGAYVSWNLYPAVKVSCDGRYEVAYPPEQVHELWDFYANQRNWQQTLQRYPPDAVLVPRPNPLEELLTKAGTPNAGPKWKLVYCDDGYVLYVRQDRVNGLPVVDRSGETVTARFP